MLLPLRNLCKLSNKSFRSDNIASAILHRASVTLRCLRLFQIKNVLPTNQILERKVTSRIGLSVYLPPQLHRYSVTTHRYGYATTVPVLVEPDVILIELLTYRRRFPAHRSNILNSVCRHESSPLIAFLPKLFKKPPHGNSPLLFYFEDTIQIKTYTEEFTNKDTNRKQIGHTR